MFRARSHFFRLRKIPASEESCYAIISSCIYELLVINAGGGGYRHGKRVGISIKLALWDKKWTNQRKTARSTSLCCRRLSSSDSPMGSPKRLSVKRTMCCVASKLYASSFHQQMTSNARFLCVCSLHGYGKKPSFTNLLLDQVYLHEFRSYPCQMLTFRHGQKFRKRHLMNLHWSFFSPNICTLPKSM